jgi:preprotein translocase subunit SecG
VANPDRDTVYTNDGVNRTVYSRESNSTGWFVGIIVALALLAIAYLVFSANSQPSTVDVNNSPTVTTPAPVDTLPAPTDTNATPMAPADTNTTPMAPADTAPAPTETAPIETAPAPTDTAPADTAPVTPVESAPAQ